MDFRSGNDDGVQRYVPADGSRMRVGLSYLAMTSRANPLRDAVFRDRLDEAQLALKDGHSIDELDEDSRTALQHAAIDGKREMAAFLLSSGADVDHQDALGYTALHYAAHNGFKEVVTVLLDAGAAVDSQDEHGNTPLWKAVFAFQGDDSVIRSLVLAKANPDLPNKHGVSARDLANTRGDKIFGP